MKKLIVIMAIAIVLVGAVFADGPAANDSAALTINATVKTQYPAYSLQATSSSFSTTVSGASVTLGSAAAVAGTAGTSTVTISDDVLTQANTTVVFTITQTALSRVKGVYTLAVSAGDLIITAINKPDGTQSTASADLDTTNNRFAVSAAPTIVKGGENASDPSNTALNVATAGKVAITYNGKKVAANTTIGTFSYTWNKNEEAAAGNYQATVTLTIESIS